MQSQILSGRVLVVNDIHSGLSGVPSAFHNHHYLAFPDVASLNDTTGGVINWHHILCRLRSISPYYSSRRHQRLSVGTTVVADTGAKMAVEASNLHLKLVLGHTRRVSGRQFAGHMESKVPEQTYKVRRRHVLTDGLSQSLSGQVLSICGLLRTQVGKNKAAVKLLPLRLSA